MVTGIRLPFDLPEQAAIAEARRLTGLTANDIQAAVCRVSIDARRGQISRVYSVRLDAPFDEKAFAEKLQMPFVRYKPNTKIIIPHGEKRLEHRPVVVGLGPAGLFAAYVLAKHGYRPLVLERGGDLDERDKVVDVFWKGGALDTDCNIQFGEGGAGAYSDGKLTTRIGDPLCDNVLEILAAHGAPADIVKKAKPHVGTDILKDVVREMRREIIKNGGEVRFRTPLTGVSVKNGALCAVQADGQDIACERAVLAIGHSARDTFAALHGNGVYFEPKAFSVGVRIEHLQTEIDKSLYHGAAGHPALPKGEYQLSQHVSGGRCVYTFCMCPGGTVCAAASEAGGVVTNGMSLHARDGRNANAAVVVSVDGSDFDNDPAKAVAFQRRLEQAAYRAGGGNYLAPAETVGSFLAGRGALELGAVQPTYPRGVTPCDLGGLLPDDLSGALREGLTAFGRKLAAYRAPDAVLTGLETRTSSPVRLLRDKENLQCTGLAGLYPCGEGAGYAGGIMTAAVDGVRCAAELMKNWGPMAD